MQPESSHFEPQPISHSDAQKIETVNSDPTLIALRADLANAIANDEKQSIGEIKEKIRAQSLELGIDLGEPVKEESIN